MQVDLTNEEIFLLQQLLKDKIRNVEYNNSPFINDRVNLGNMQIILAKIGGKYGK